MRIGLDIDGVMYQWDKTTRYMLREVLPDSPYKDLLHQDSLSWDWVQERVAPEHWNWLWTEGVRLGLFRYGHLYSGTIQAVRELATLGEVVLITHRPKQAVNDTLAWLTYQNLPLAGVHLLTNQENKASVRPWCDVYLDDKPENITDLCEGTPAQLVCLMRRPWNLAWEHPPTGQRFEVVKDWKEFIQKVRARWNLI